MKKAIERKKISLTIQDIEKRMAEQEEDQNFNKGAFKIFFPHWIYVSDDIKMQLINFGYKVYVGDWDHVMNNALIIEW